MLTGRSSVLESALPRPFELDGPQELGITGFVTYYYIPNIDRLFIYSENPDENLTGILFPIGAYEIDGIEEYLQAQLGGAESIRLKVNAQSALKISIKFTY